MKNLTKESVEQRRINRINDLLDRLDRIPFELDVISERLYTGNITREEFASLVDRRNALYIELENKEHEIKEVYRIKDDAE